MFTANNNNKFSFAGRYSVSALCPRPPRVLPPGVSAASGAPPARRRVLARVGPGGTAAAGVPAL